MSIGAPKPKAALKLLFEPGQNFKQLDMADVIESMFNPLSDVFDTAWIQDGTIGENHLNASALTFLNTIDGIRAWNVNTSGDFLPFTSHFQDIGSPLDTVKELHADDLFIYESTTLPLNTTIGTITSDEISYLAGLTGSIQTQIDNIVISGGGVLNYTHVQNVPSVLWTIIHNKATENVVYTLLDENGYEFIPDTFRVIDLNTVEFSFAANQLGKVNMIFY